MALSTMTVKGQVTIPKNVRDSLHLHSGDKVEFVFNEKNEVILKPVTKKSSDVFSCLSQYKKKTPVSVEDMDDAIKKKMKQKFL